MKKNHLVTILGRELSVRSSAPADKVQAVETFINQRLHGIGAALKSSDPQLILILALLNTSEELLELRSSRSTGEQVDDKLQSLLQQLHDL